MVTIEEIESVCRRMMEQISSEELAMFLDVDQDQARKTLSESLAEARQTLYLTLGLPIGSQSKVLEVGVGMGIASTAMSLFGFEVVGIEPGGIGFEKNRQISSYISGKTGSTFRLLSESAENVKFQDEERFDLILSNNVLEHVQDIEKSLANLYSYLKESGIMIHSCPNYAFPFEPHFGIPLIPFFPSLTRFLLPKSTSSSGLWNSLNFITASKVRKIGKKHGFTVVFKKRTMYRSIQRLATDQEFKKRHSLLARFASNLFISRGLACLVSLPAGFSTPMEFLICHRSIKKSKTVIDWQKNEFR